MKKALIPSLLALALGFAGLAAAHGTGTHVSGTVTKIEQTKLELKTPAGKDLAIALTPATRYLKGLKRSNPATSADVKVGVRVIVDVVKKGDALEATEVKIGKDPGAAK